MTKFDASSGASPDADSNAASTAVKRLLIGLIGGFCLLFLAGVIAGYSSVAFSYDTLTTKDVITLSALAATFAGIALAMWKFWPGPSDEPVAPSTKKSNRIIWIMIALSLVLGIFLGLTDTTQSFLTNKPIEPMVALVALVGWVIVVPVLTWLWWRSVDEHEASAYTDGALISAHIYPIATPAWWFAWRAGWMPEQDPMVMFLLIAITWSVIWLYRRYS